jgi:hypothetical protein
LLQDAHSASGQYGSPEANRLICATRAGERVSVSLTTVSAASNRPRYALSEELFVRQIAHQYGFQCPSGRWFLKSVNARATLTPHRKLLNILI